MTFLTHTPTTEIYPLSLHDALPISTPRRADIAQKKMPGVSRAFFAFGQCGDAYSAAVRWCTGSRAAAALAAASLADRKSTRLNSSHPSISYAVFCLKKKTNTTLRDV